MVTSEKFKRMEAIVSLSDRVSLMSAVVRITEDLCQDGFEVTDARDFIKMLVDANIKRNFNK